MEYVLILDGSWNDDDVAGYDLFSQATLCGVKGIQRQGTTPLEQFKLSHDIYFLNLYP